MRRTPAKCEGCGKRRVLDAEGFCHECHSVLAFVRSIELALIIMDGTLERVIGELSTKLKAMNFEGRKR